MYNIIYNNWKRNKYSTKNAANNFQKKITILAIVNLAHFNSVHSREQNIE